MDATEERFWVRVDKNGRGGCWLWSGRKIASNGGDYGGLNFHGRAWTAHRLSYTLLRGEISEGLVLDHLCRNTLCVNPDHLEVVTHRENILRGKGIAARNAKKTHCKRGHEFTSQNTYVRLNQSSGATMRACRRCAITRARESKRRIRPTGGRP